MDSKTILIVAVLVGSIWYFSRKANAAEPDQALAKMEAVKAVTQGASSFAGSGGDELAKLVKYSQTSALATNAPRSAGAPPSGPGDAKMSVQSLPPNVASKGNTLLQQGKNYVNKSAVAGATAVGTAYGGPVGGLVAGYAASKAAPIVTNTAVKAASGAGSAVKKIMGGLSF
jgi:hypothetical protein